jgi:hypothetical protein
MRAACNAVSVELSRSAALQVCAAASDRYLLCWAGDFAKHLNTVAHPGKSGCSPHVFALESRALESKYGVLIIGDLKICLYLQQGVLYS